MKIKFTIAMLFLFSVLALRAQQPVQYSMYGLNKLAFNPGYTGLENSLSITGAYRTQWVGLPGSPTSQSFNAHMPFYALGGGVGVAAENETIGSWRQTSFAANYAYHVPVGKASLFSLGISLGMVQRQLDGSKVRTPSTEVDDLGNIDHNDSYLPVGLENGSGPTAQFGLYYQGEKLEVGFSAVNLLGNQVAISNVDFTQARTYFLVLGYQLDVGKKISAFPSLLLKSDVYQTQMDFSLTAKYNENIFVGTSLRGYGQNSLDAVVLMGGFKLNDKISIGYAYDFGLSKLRNANTGSHEVVVNYNLGLQIGKGRPPAIIYNPRSL